MRSWQMQFYWLARLFASDPGLKRFEQAGKVILSVMSSVFTMLLLLFIFQGKAVPAAIIAGVLGMMGILTVADDTEKQKKITTLLLPLASITAVTLGSFLSGYGHLVDAVILLVVVLAFYLQKYGARYFSICMVGFMSIYFASLLRLQPAQLPWLFAGILVGITFAFLYNFVFFKTNPEKVLKRSIRSFHTQTNLAFSLILEMIKDPVTKPERIRKLINNVRRLREYARMISGDLSSAEVHKVWPGVSTNQLRLYVFDSEMLTEALTDAIIKLKSSHALEYTELRRLLVWVVESIRNAEVLAEEYETFHLQEAEKALQGIRFALNDLYTEKEQSGEWLYLVQRIETIANHVIEGAFSIQEAMNKKLSGNELREYLLDVNSEAAEQTDEEEDQEDKEDKEDKYNLPRKKALQALVAGAISIVLGYLLTSTHQYWILLTAFIVLLGTESVGRTYIKAFQRSFGTVLGGIAGFGMALAVEGQQALQLICLFASIFLAFYLFQVSYTLMSFFITMMMALMYDLLLGGVTLQLLGARVLDTIIGAGIAFVVSYWLLPVRTKDKVADLSVEYLEDLKNCLNEYMNHLLSGEQTLLDFTNTAFEMDQKLEEMKNHTKQIFRRAGSLDPSGFSKWINTLGAVHYYAKHLVASSNRTLKREQAPEYRLAILHIKDVLQGNIDIITSLLANERNSAAVRGLEKQRKTIEKGPETDGKREHAQIHLLHYLYYIWPINEALLQLAEDLGAARKDLEEEQETKRHSS
ncbi:FUSC family protein [Metabacillus sp. GX 13764]|uniref:FUSC family protein n=1 Tax=Metabacillus kandeliae TaxID=2900151 RepID=UPI001E42B2F8|nr:FUSC family protein [Metabacillus kandeliae]MCD7034034.1 FUSC family protein [Metabacillus kandeliae]